MSLWLFSATIPTQADARLARLPPSRAGKGTHMDKQQLVRRYEEGERSFILLSLHRADLSGIDLSHANLSGSDLREVDLSNANLAGASLRRADLKGANLCGTDLTLADLHKADLSNATLEGARITPEQLDEVISLEGAILPDGARHE